MGSKMKIISNKVTIDMASHDDSISSSRDLRLYSILMLIHSMDVVDYDRYGADIHDELGKDLDAIAKAVHDVAAQNGW